MTPTPIMDHETVATALCVWEAMIDANVKDTARETALARQWDGVGTAEMRDHAIAIAQWIEADITTDPAFNGLADQWSFDWDVVPAILRFVQWSDDGWSEPEMTVSELLDAVRAHIPTTHTEVSTHG
jgi:hypothetical protein